MSDRRKFIRQTVVSAAALFAGKRLFAFAAAAGAQPAMWQGRDTAMVHLPEMSMLRVAGAVLPAPSVYITIAVNTAYVASTPQYTVKDGIYMMDNMCAGGSTGEGTMNLDTRCAVGSLIGFRVVPIDETGNSGSVTIIGFNTGGVFASGYPERRPSPDNRPEGSYWLGQAMKQGTEAYQIFIQVDTGLLQPAAPRIIEWEAKITVG